MKSHVWSPPLKKRTRTTFPRTQQDYKPLISLGYYSEKANKQHYNDTLLYIELNYVPLCKNDRTLDAWSASQSCFSHYFWIYVCMCNFWLGYTCWPTSHKVEGSSPCHGYHGGVNNRLSPKYYPSLPLIRSVIGLISIKKDSLDLLVHIWNILTKFWFFPAFFSLYEHRPGCRHLTVIMEFIKELINQYTNYFKANLTCF